MVKDSHIGEDGDVRERYRRQGPFKGLLWFPETYRRPDENIGGKGSRDEPMLSQIAKDFRFFADTASSREGWAGVLNYVLFRNLQAEWADYKYYTYLPALRQYQSGPILTGRRIWNAVDAVAG